MINISPLEAQQGWRRRAGRGAEAAGTQNLGLASGLRQLSPHQGSLQGWGTLVDFRKVPPPHWMEQDLVPEHPSTGVRHLSTLCLPQCSQMTHSHFTDEAVEVQRR